LREKGKSAPEEKERTGGGRNKVKKAFRKGGGLSFHLGMRKRTLKSPHFEEKRKKKRYIKTPGRGSGDKTFRVKSSKLKGIKCGLLA